MSLLKVISSWLDRYFANEQTLALLLFLGLVFFALIYFGVVLAPLMSGLIGAFLLNGVANKLERYRMSRVIAVLSCLVIFLLVIFFVVTSKVGDSQFLSLELPKTESFQYDTVQFTNEIVNINVKSTLLNIT